MKASGKPSVVGLCRRGVWKWKVYLPGSTHAPEFRVWDDAMRVANEVAWRSRQNA